MIRGTRNKRERVLAAVCTVMACLWMAQKFLAPHFFTKRNEASASLARLQREWRLNQKILAGEKNIQQQIADYQELFQKNSEMFPEDEDASARIQKMADISGVRIVESHPRRVNLSRSVVDLALESGVVSLVAFLNQASRDLSCSITDFSIEKSKNGESLRVKAVVEYGGVLEKTADSKRFEGL